jgi:hypothetical protein
LVIFRLYLCILIVILNFILKLEIIIQYEHQDKDEILIIDIHHVIFIVLEQRRKLKLRKFLRINFVYFSNEIYRFNLEQGQYLEPIQSKSTYEN